MRYLILAALTLNACFFKPITATADERTHRETVEILFKLLGMEEAHKRGMEQMLAIQVQQNPQIGLFKDVQREFFSKYMRWEILKDEFIKIYMEEFSEDEIRDLIAFYKTPTGQKTIKKMPILMSKGTQLGARRIQENMPELHQMIQDENDRLKLQRRKGTSHQSRK